MMASMQNGDKGSFFYFIDATLLLGRKLNVLSKSRKSVAWAFRPPTLMWNMPR